MLAVRLVTGLANKQTRLLPVLTIWSTRPTKLVHVPGIGYHHECTT